MTTQQRGRENDKKSSSSSSSSQTNPLSASDSLQPINGQNPKLCESLVRLLYKTPLPFLHCAWISDWISSSLRENILVAFVSSQAWMGAIFSRSFSASSSAPPTASLGDLPEGCVASVLNHLEPKDICQLARLNRAFRGASWADFVWESKLPENYRALFRQLFDLSSEDLRKRDIYRRLCATNTFDGDTKVQPFCPLLESLSFFFRCVWQKLDKAVFPPWKKKRMFTIESKLEKRVFFCFLTCFW